MRNSLPELRGAEGFAVIRVCSIFGAVFWKFLFLKVAILRFYKTTLFAVFRNFRVISMRLAVFLRYSTVRCLFVILCGFAVFVPPLRTPRKYFVFSRVFPFPFLLFSL